MTHIIIETGNNSNGYYRKYADGTLEMWGEKVFTNLSINKADNWNYYGDLVTITYPVKSINVLPRPVAIGRSSYGGWFNLKDNGLTYEAFSGWPYCSSSGTARPMFIAWHCFGAWK